MATEPTDPTRTSTLHEAYQTQEKAKQGDAQKGQDTAKTASQGVPKSISQDRPKLTLEMKGPDGDQVRKAIKKEQFDKDRPQADKDRASKYISGKEKGGFVVSKDNVRDGQRNLLNPEFSKTQEKDR